MEPKAESGDKDERDSRVPRRRRDDMIRVVRRLPGDAFPVEGVKRSTTIGNRGAISLQEPKGLQQKHEPSIVPRQGVGSFRARLDRGLELSCPLQGTASTSLVTDRLPPQQAHRSSALRQGLLQEISIRSPIPPSVQLADERLPVEISTAQHRLAQAIRVAEP